MDEYFVKRSKFSLIVGYLLAESVLIAFLVGMIIIWFEDSGYLDWPIAIFSWVFAALFFHFLLFKGTFYKIKVMGGEIEYHAFLRRKKKFSFSDIVDVKSSAGTDMKIIGYDNKLLFYVKLTDKNAGRLLDDVSAHLNRKIIL